MGFGMKLKAQVAGWLKPVLPSAQWIDRAIWYQRLDEVVHAVDRRRFDQVEPMLQGLERDLPEFPSDPGTRVGRLTRLAELFRDLAGNFDAAERLLREAIELGESASVDYWTVALPMNDLGLLLIDQRRYGEAERILEALTDRTREERGENDPDLASCLENLAAVYRQTGRTAEASRIRAQAVRIRRTAVS